MMFLCFFIVFIIFIFDIKFINFWFVVFFVSCNEIESMIVWLIINDYFYFKIVILISEVIVIYFVLWENSGEWFVLFVF